MLGSALFIVMVEGRFNLIFWDSFIWLSQFAFAVSVGAVFVELALAFLHEELAQLSFVIAIGLAGHSRDNIVWQLLCKRYDHFG